MNRRALVLFGEDLPAVVLAQLDAGGTSAAWLIDVEAGRLVAANAHGAALLGLDSAARSDNGPALSPPSLDASMPALVRLRAVATHDPAPHDPEPQGDRLEPLIFWTRNGTLRVLCRFRIFRAGSRTFALVAVHDQTPNFESALRPPPSLFRESDAEHTSDPEFSPTLRARLAHELKTPLSAIAAAAEIMKEERFGPLGTPRYLGYASDILGSAQHALGVIERMLAESAGNDPLSIVGALEFAEIDAGAVLEAAVSQVTPLAERAGVSLTFEPASRLPHIIADVTSLRQIVFNLLTNAIKFTGRGGSVKATARYSVDGPFTVLISDTGPGMTKDDIDSASDATRASRAGQSRAGAGLGLGLPMVQMLAQANGADLIIDSVPGRGTSVSVVFRKERVIPV
jgi:hypothetical protein